MRVHKYVLSLQDTAYVYMPKGAEILSTNVQHDEICVWALVDPEATLVKRPFAILGTGHEADTIAGLTHIGTVLMNGGNYVWHVFIGDEDNDG